MKIKIKTEGFRMTLLFPTSLVLSNFGISIILQIAGKYIAVPKENKKTILKEVKQWRKQWKGLSLVEVQTSRGEEILIKL